MENPEERSSKFNKWVYDKASFQIGGEKKNGGGGRKKVSDVGRRLWREENLCIHMADPKCRTAEIHTTSWDNYSQIKKEKEKRWKKRKWHLQCLLLQTYWGDRPSHASLRETHTNFLIKRVDLEALFLFVWGILYHMTFSPFLARAHWTRNDKNRHRETNPGTGLN